LAKPVKARRTDAGNVLVETQVRRQRHANDTDLVTRRDSFRSKGVPVLINSLTVKYTSANVRNATCEESRFRCRRSLPMLSASCILSTSIVFCTSHDKSSFSAVLFSSSPSLLSAAPAAESRGTSVDADSDMVVLWPECASLSGSRIFSRLRRCGWKLPIQFEE